MSLDERVSDLIRRIYCASDDAHWDQLAVEVLSRTRAHSAFTTVVDLQNSEFCSSHFYGADETVIARAFEEYPAHFRDDPTLIWATNNPAARFCDSRQTLAPDAYRSSPYVHWQRDRLRSDHWFVGYTAPQRSRSFSFSLLFPVDQDQGRAEAIQLFRMLFDHMDAAVQLRGKSFDAASPAAAVSINERGQVDAVSLGAVELIALGDGVDIVDRRLTVSSPDDQAALDKAMARAAKTFETGDRPSAVKISRLSGARPWIAVVRPDLRFFPRAGATYCGARVEFRESVPKSTSPEMLQSFFGLTQREATVLWLLHRGHSVASLAYASGISPNTARVHLHSIFAKTSTTRQSELLQLCDQLAAI